MKTYFWSFFVLLSACQPLEEISLDFQESDLSIQGQIQDFFILNDQLFIIGGDQWNSGWAYSTNDGLSFDLILQDINQLRSLKLGDSLLFTGGLSGRIISFSLSGQVIGEWYLDPFDWVQDIEVHNDQVFAFTAVNNREEGKIYRLQHDNLEKIYEGKQGIMAGEITADGHLLSTGFGIMLFCNRNFTCERKQLDGESWVHMEAIDDTTFMAVAQSGGISKSENSGEDWYNLQQANRVLTPNTPFTASAFLNKQEGYLCGWGGVLWQTLDEGRNWREVSNVPNYNYLAASIWKGMLVLGTDDARLVFVRI